GLGPALELSEGDLELVQALVAGLVDARRLTGRAYEPAREQIREARVVLPIGDDAPQQVGPAQERAVARGRPSQRQMVATTGAGVGAVKVERLGAEPGGAGVGVDARDD